MAFDYTGANTGVFTRIGKIIKYINSRLAGATTTLPAELKAIADLYEAADFTNLIEGLYSLYAGVQRNLVSERQSLASFIDATLVDRNTVLTQIGVLNANLLEVLPALRQRMVLDSQTIDASTVTVGSVAAAAGNTGNGTVLVTKVLDGYNPPLIGALADRSYNGVNSELAVPSETMTLTCIADQARDGTLKDQERFSWQGGIKGDVLDYQSEGSGPGPGLTVATASTLISNGKFETWSGAGNNTPGSWTVANGTAGTHIFRESSTIYADTYALKFTGTGAQATIGLKQTVTASRLKARRMYNVSVRMRASATPTNGDFRIQFSGTGYTAGSNKIEVLAAAIPTSFTLYNMFIRMPDLIPSDFALNIEWVNTPDNAKSLYVDNVTFTEVAYHGGVGAVVIPGSAQFIVGDSFTFTLANDAAGTFQEFFRKRYGYQLPSNVAAGETILDSLAE